MAKPNQKRKKGEEVFKAAVVFRVGADGKPAKVAIYGKPTKEGLHEWSQSTKGHLMPTNNTELVVASELREILFWGGKAVGVAESFFPHPKEWRFEGLDAPLDKVTVRLLTRALSAARSVEPACRKAWEDRVGALPKDIGEMYNTKLLTPRDWASHFKNVMHRALLVRSVTTGEPCRCCGVAYENIQHFTHCEKAKDIFTELHAMSGAPPIIEEKEWERFCLFGLLPQGKMEEGWTALLLLLWKHLIAHLVQIEIEGARFKTTNVWAPAWKRLERKILALGVKVKDVNLRADSRGMNPPDARPRSKPMPPIANFTEEGSLEWNETITERLRALTK